MQPRGPGVISSRSALRKGLGLERLAAKVSAPAGTATLELWVQYQLLKVQAVHTQELSSTVTADGISAAVSKSSQPATTQSLTSPLSAQHGWSHNHRTKPLVEQSDHSSSVQSSTTAAPRNAASFPKQDIDTMHKQSHNSEQGMVQAGVQKLAHASLPAKCAQHVVPKWGRHPVLDGIADDAGCLLVICTNKVTTMLKLWS